MTAPPVNPNSLDVRPLNPVGRPFARVEPGA